MTNSSVAIACLKQAPSNIFNILKPTRPIFINDAVIIGRDSSCQIVLSAGYQGISKKHLEIRPIFTSGSKAEWKICDLGSTNGTYVNNQLLQSTLPLKSGDRIRLGSKGPEFIFQLSSSTSAQKPESTEDTNLSHTELIPLLATYRELPQKAYLVPGFFTVVFAILLFDQLSATETICTLFWLNPFGVFRTSCYNILLGSYLALIGFYVVYLQCGKPKPWWVLASSGLITLLILSTELLTPFLWLFRDVLPGDTDLLMDQLTEGKFVSPLTWFITMFFGTGLMEELLKAVPVLMALYIGRQLKSPLQEQIGVWEPLDGILLGSASAVGFTLFETLGQYVPVITTSAGATSGLMLLVPRFIGSIAGHIAYSGYFGYFIGLSALRPRNRWKILCIGYLVAAILHTLWNSVHFFAATEQSELFLLCLVGITAYIFLMAATLKARKLSPNRAHNFATQIHSKNSV